MARIGAARLALWLVLALAVSTPPTPQRRPQQRRRLRFVAAAAAAALPPLDDDPGPATSGVLEARRGTVGFGDAAEEWRGEVVHLSWRPRAFLYKRFLSDAECDHLIALVRFNVAGAALIAFCIRCCCCSCTLCARSSAIAKPCALKHSTPPPTTTPTNKGARPHVGVGRRRQRERRIRRVAAAHVDGGVPRGGADAHRGGDRAPRRARRDGAARKPRAAADPALRARAALRCARAAWLAAGGRRAAAAGRPATPSTLLSLLHLPLS